MKPITHSIKGKLELVKGPLGRREQLFDHLTWGSFNIEEGTTGDD